MEEEYYHLQPIGLTQGVSLSNIYLIMLREEKSLRIAPILISKEECGIIDRAMHKQDFSTITLMLRLAHSYDIFLERVQIKFSNKGIASTVLYFKSGKEEKHLTSNIANGVVAALNQQVPLVITAQDFSQHILKHQTEGKVAVPLSMMTEDLLNEALKSAVKEENYELASVIRDEIKLRNKELGLS